METLKFLSTQQKEFYDENGYILLDNVFTDEEVNQLSKEYEDLFKRKEKEHAQMEALWDGNWKEDLVTNPKAHVKSIHNLQNHSSVFTKAILHDRMLDAVEDATGCTNLILHHTKAHLKPSEDGAPFPMHQDYHYFPYENDSLVAIFIHLDDTTPENGGLSVYPGSHKLGPLKDTSDKQGFHYVDQSKFSLTEATPVTAKKGAVLIFSYLLVHGSYVNRSKHARKMFLIEIANAEDRPKQDIHISPSAGMVLRGRNVNTNADLNKRSKMEINKK